MDFKPFIKQLFVASSTMLAALSVGGAATYPTVLLHQLRAKNTSIQLDFDTASWIGSIHGLAGIPTIFLPNIMQWRGRKLAIIGACVITTIGWIVAYYAKSATAILVSECFHGLGSNSVLTVSYLSLSEMMSPQYRHTFMNTYAVLQSFGMAMNGIMTQYIHWKTISVIMCIPMVIAVVVACMWPESPYWLALKGQYSECEEAFIWLRGSDDESKKEIIKLINAQKEHFITHKNEDRMSLKLLLRQIKRRDFYLPCLHMFVLQYLFYWSGNVVILIYSVQMIEKITQNPNAAFYGPLMINSLIFLGIITNIILMKFFKKKSILLCCSFLGFLSMVCASLISYLQTSDVISKESLLCLFALIGYVIVDGVGILPVSYAMAVEIMPVKHRGIGGALTVICTCLFHTSSLKISPYLFLYINMWGTFLVYSLNTMFCLLFIWRFVPDTSGKTLQEIESYYNLGRYVDQDVVEEEMDRLGN